MRTDYNRDNQELLVDYAKALRDGSIPEFLKSLSGPEARRLRFSLPFQEGVGAARAVVAAAFADQIQTPSTDLFIARVNVRIAARAKQAGAPTPRTTAHAHTRRVHHSPLHN
ncbi:MAG TPA: hypothetical protein ENN81_05910 [Phycisphaerales bacterium]|nr:hypothetical protein [Phycisphaerales bacterium]